MIMSTLYDHQESTEVTHTFKVNKGGPERLFADYRGDMFVRVIFKDGKLLRVDLPFGEEGEEWGQDEWLVVAAVGYYIRSVLFAPQPA